jgi:hypothetical protein
MWYAVIKKVVDGIKSCYASNYILTFFIRTYYVYVKLADKLCKNIINHIKFLIIIYSGRYQMCVQVWIHKIILSKRRIFFLLWQISWNSYLFSKLISEKMHSSRLKSIKITKLLLRGRKYKLFVPFTFAQWIFGLRQINGGAHTIATNDT